LRQHLARLVREESYVRGTELARQLENRRVARAKSIVVLIDAATRRATPLTDPLINALYEVGQYGFHNRFSAGFRVRSAIKGVLVRL
jgi:hypothetical protein